VAENLFLENPLVQKSFGLVSHGRLTAEARAHLAKWNMDIRVESLAGELRASAR
jgi:ABC-type sugar transport system ATPase subunit